MADAPHYSRLNRALYFCDLLEDDRSKLSLTKAGAWLGMIGNYANMVYQFCQAHPSVVMMAGTTMAHLGAAIKHELKRRAP